jgi:hypothetical protein
MDGLGLHTFDGANFENTLEQLISHWPESHQQYSSALPRHMTSPYQIHSPSHEDIMATLSRPGVPIPPTPQPRRAVAFTSSSQEWATRMV